MQMLLLTLLAVCACYGSQPNPHHPQMKPDAFTGISNNENQGKPSSSINPSATVVHVKIRETDPISRNVQSERSSMSLSDSSNSSSQVSKLSEFPYEERIESMLFLTNALILTEAVRLKKLNMSQVVIDLMIIGQFEGMENWFEVLNSAEVDAESLKGIDVLFNQLGPLHDAIENGFPEILDTGVLETAVLVMNKIGVIDEAINYARRYKELLEGLDLNIFNEIKSVKSLLETLMKLPNVLEALKNVNNQTFALNYVEAGVDLVNQVKTSQEWKSAVEVCKVVVDKSLVDRINCGKKLKEAVMQFAIPNNATLNSIRDAVAVMNVLGTDPTVSRWEELIGLVNKMSIFTTQLKAIVEFRKKNDLFENIKKLRLLINYLEKLSTSSNQLRSVKIALADVKPVQEIVEIFKNIYKSGGNAKAVKSTPISFFKTYEGFPDGMMSMKELSKRVGPSHAVPTQIFKSKTAQRVEVIRNWVDNLSPMIGSKDAFVKVRHLWRIVSSLETTVNKGIPQDLKAKLDTIEDCYVKMPQTDSISTTFENLIEMISDFNGKKWRTDLIQVVSNCTDSISKAGIVTLSNVLHTLPKFVDLSSKLKTNFNLLLALNEKDSAYEIQLGEIIKTMESEIEDGMKITKEFTENSDTLTVPPELVTIKERLQKSPMIIDLKLKNNNLTYDISKVSVAGSSLSTLFSSKDKATVDSFVLDANSINPKFDASDFALNFVKPEEIESVKNFLESISTSRLNKTQIEKSDHISKLMEETPSGYKFLSSMRAGVMNYRKFSDGYAAFLEFKNYVDKRRKRFMRHVDQSNLVNYIGKMFESVKPIAINGNDSTVYGLLRDFSSFINPLAKFATDSKNIKVENKLIIRKDLEGLMVELKINPTMKRRLQQINKLVNILEDTFSDKISKLVSGLKDFYSILTFVDCVKEPSLAECIVARAISASSSSSSGIDIWYKIGAGVIVLVFVIAAIVAICIVLCQKEHHADEKKKLDAALQEAERKNEILDEKNNCLYLEKEEAEERERKKEANIQILLQIKQEAENKNVENEAKLNGLIAQLAKAVTDRSKTDEELDKLKKGIELQILATLKGFEESKDTTRFLRDLGFFGGISNSIHDITDISKEHRKEFINHFHAHWKILVNPKNKEVYEEGEFWRYKKALYKENCVLLEGETGSPSINGSEIRGIPGGVTYYAVQAPRPNKNEPNSNDVFFKMLVQKKVKTVIQLCSNNEPGKEPIDYTKEGEHLDYAVVKIGTQRLFEGVTSTEFMLVHLTSKEEYLFSHVLFTTWPDLTAPKNPEIFFEMAEWLLENNTDPVVVHCAAGLGRTMAFIGLIDGMASTETFTTSTQNITLFSILRDMRLERREGIQVAIQVLFIEYGMCYRYSKRRNEHQERNIKLYEIFKRLTELCFDDIVKMCQKEEKSKKKNAKSVVKNVETKVEVEESNVLPLPEWVQDVAAVRIAAKKLESAKPKGENAKAKKKNANVDADKKESDEPKKGDVKADVKKTESAPPKKGKAKYTLEKVDSDEAKKRNAKSVVKKIDSGTPKQVKTKADVKKINSDEPKKGNAKSVVKKIESKTPKPEKAKPDVKKTD